MADGSNGTARAADKDDYAFNSGETAKEETVTPTLGPSWLIIAAPSALTTALDKADSVIDERGRAWCACGGHQGPTSKPSVVIVPTELEDTEDPKDAVVNDETEDTASHGGRRRTIPTELLRNVRFRIRI